MHKVAIVIPAYNESLTISSVVSSTLTYGCPIVVNDCSTDATAHLASSAGALVVSLPNNQGYDSALTIGIAKAIEQGFDFAISIDGDGQHDPTKIKHFIEKLSHDADLVVGVRKYFQRPAEAAFAGMAKMLWGISDPLCGMKGYRLSKLKLFTCLSTYQSIGTELTIRAVRSGWNVQEVPIETSLRQGKSRFGSGFIANWRVCKAMIVGLLKARGIN